MNSDLRCPACETGTLTKCTGPVLSEAIWADPMTTTGVLTRKMTLTGFLACNSCEWVRRVSDVLKGNF